MSALRQVRGWLSAKRRFQFCLTLVMVTGLTAACGALLMLPNSVLPKIRAVVPGGDALVATDPQVSALHRLMDSYGKVISEPVNTGAGKVGVVLGHPARSGDMDVLAAELSAATTAVSAVWGSDWSQAPVVVVASSPAEFAALTNETGAVPAEVAAATVADPFHPGAQPTGQRVVFGSEAGRRLGPDGLRSVLRHELTHVATRAVTVDRSPQWMLEGFAEYVAHRGMRQPIEEVAPTLTTRARAGTLPADLPADAAFEPASGEAAAVYEQAWSACAFIADQFGEAQLVSLYRQLATGPKDNPAVAAIVQNTLAIGYPDLLARWHSWITARTTPGA
ncbi:hypothetical protein [Nocardia sp. NPDC056000]|uniref:hypothetical protein n=1 Tax=Nocardia sp. NPDC056000 TaxID=3345674 RepID=UPI0035DE799A